jgi:hypothetical protein
MMGREPAAGRSGVARVWESVYITNQCHSTLEHLTRKATLRIPQQHAGEPMGEASWYEPSMERIFTKRATSASKTVVHNPRKPVIQLEGLRLLAIAALMCGLGA